MQRINLFPNPNFAGPLTGNYRWGGANGAVRDNALHVTGSSGGYGFNVPVPFNVPLVLSMRVDASEDNVAGMIIVQPTDRPGVNNTLASQKFKRGISDVLQRFTVTSHGVRFEVNPNGIRDVAVSNVLIERADTYDNAVGGASGLLHRGHDATRLRRLVGRVISDDADYKLACASESGHRIPWMERYNRHCERGRDENLLHRQRRSDLPLPKHERDQDHNVLVRRCRPIPGGACESGGTRHCRAAQWGEGRYLGIQRHPSLGGGKYEVSVFRSGKGLSDPDLIGDLHARKLGEIAGNGSDVVRRGYDAARLTLMGVMA